MISNIQLTHTFGQWLVNHNEVVDLVNFHLDESVLDGLSTDNKNTYVAAINELNTEKLDKSGGTISGSLDLTGVLNVSSKIQVGQNGGGDSVIEFFDDSAGAYRSLKWDDTESKFILEDSSGTDREIHHEASEVDYDSIAGTMQLWRGTTDENDAYTGKEGELTYDTEKEQIRVHDGSTAGGHRFVSGDVDEFSTDETMSDNSDLAVPTEKAVKAYVDAVANALGNLANKDTIDTADIENNAITLAKIAHDYGNSKLIGTNSSGTPTVYNANASTTSKGLVERATDSEASDGSDTTRYVTPYQLKNYGGAGGGLGSYFEYTFPLDTYHDNVSHGLGTTPTLITGFLKNVNAEGGYEPGDMISLEMNATYDGMDGVGWRTVLGMWCNSSDVGYAYQKGTKGILLPYKDASNYFNMGGTPNSNWDLVIRVWA